MPALELAQETGRLIRWLKREGEAVAKGEPVMEIETDKVTVEIEAPDSGTLGGVSANEGDVIPVGQTIAWILAAGESAPAAAVGRAGAPAPPKMVPASPLARKIAHEHGVDLARVKNDGRRIEKADVLAFLEASAPAVATIGAAARVAASPKARRLASERGVDLAGLAGSGPGGAILAADVPPAARAAPPPAVPTDDLQTPGRVWRVMAERMTHSWTSVPHFYLVREVAARGLVDMRARIGPAVEKRAGLKPTYTDLLVKLIAGALRDHPRLNASWTAGGIRTNADINVGIATAVEDGLIVPVIHGADALSVGEIAARRGDLVARANDNRLRPGDVAGGTFTLTNLGMYGVDAFNAIVNPPQAAILAVGRIADRVVPADGVPAVRRMMTITLSCDHRVVDGARAASFLDDLANLIEEPWGVLA